MNNLIDQYRERVEVSKALFVETGTYNDMTMRPYETNFDQNLVNQFGELTLGGTSVSPAALSGIANQFLIPSAQAQTNVTIAEGWDTPRLRFILELTYYDGSGRASMRKILQGYTNHVGVAPSGAIDFNMMLYFNNVVTLRQSTIMTENGSSLRTSVGEASHLIRGDYDMTLGGQPNITWLMRPEDVFSTMGSSALGEEDILDLRVTFANTPVKKSRRSNGSASHYVSDVIKGYRHSVDSSNYNVDFADALNKASGLVREQPMSGDKFFFDLTNNTASFAQGGSVTYGEMCSLYPEFDNVAVIIPRKQMVHSQPQGFMGGYSERGQGEYWTSSNNETVWATVLAQSIPSIMVDGMLTKVTFMATNQTLDGAHSVQMMDAGSFADGLNLVPYVEHFITRLKSEILTGLSNNNHIDYALTASIDVLGDSNIRIRIADGPETDFTSPSFCDALFAPILTNSQSHISKVAYDLQALSDTIGVDAIHQQGTNLNMNTGGFNGTDI